MNITDVCIPPPVCMACLSCLCLCSAGLLASTYIEVQEVQQVKESYDALLVRVDVQPLGRIDLPSLQLAPPWVSGPDF